MPLPSNPKDWTCENVSSWTKYVIDSYQTPKSDTAPLCYPRHLPSSKRFACCDTVAAIAAPSPSPLERGWMIHRDIVSASVPVAKRAMQGCTTKHRLQESTAYHSACMRLPPLPALLWRAGDRTLQPHQSVSQASMCRHGRIVWFVLRLRYTTRHCLPV